LLNDFDDCFIADFISWLKPNAMNVDIFCLMILMIASLPILSVG
jgi:hypothetical protein